jgi:hypothetical protein
MCRCTQLNAYDIPKLRAATELMASAVAPSGLLDALPNHFAAR